METDKVNILIVEDEGIVALAVEDTLQSAGYRVAGMTDNGKEALDILKNRPVDLALLDIQIKGDWDGVETARQLTKNQELPFIYLTAFSDEETVKKAKGTTPSAYLVKPYQPKNLLIAIELALNNFAKQKSNPGETVITPENPTSFDGLKEEMLVFNEALFIKQNYHFKKVAIGKIQYLEASGNYSRIHVPEHKYTVHCTLKRLLKKLGEQTLIRIHRSYAINLYRITSFDSRSVCLGDKEIPIGRQYKPDFFRRFNTI